MLESRPIEQATVPSDDKIVQVSGASGGTSRTLKVYEQTVLCYATAGALTLTLPNVLEAKGKLFSIYCKDLTGPSTVVVQDNDESLGWSDLTLTADADHVLLYSDGLQWNVLIDVTT